MPELFKVLSARPRSRNVMTYVSINEIVAGVVSPLTLSSSTLDSPCYLSLSCSLLLPTVNLLPFLSGVLGDSGVSK